MTTLKQLAQVHRVNPTSLRLWLKSETQIRPKQSVIDGRVTSEYDRKAADAVAAFLKDRPKRGPGRPKKSTAE